MDISLIQSQNQGSGGNKSATPGLGGLFAQMLMGMAPSEPPPAESGGEPQVAQTSNQDRPDQDGTPRNPDASAGEAPNDSQAETPLETPGDAAVNDQPVAATAGQTQPEAAPAIPVAPSGSANGQTATADAAQGTPPAAPGDSAVGTAQNGAIPSPEPTPDPAVPGSQVADAATPTSDRNAGENPQGQNNVASGQSAATTTQSPDSTTDTPGTQLPTEAESAKPLDGARPQTAAAEAAQPTPVEPAKTPQAPTQPAAAPHPTLAAQAAAQPAASVARQAQPGETTKAPATAPKSDAPSGDPGDAPAERVTTMPTEPNPGGTAKSDPRQIASRDGQQQGQQQPVQQAPTQSNAAPPDFLESLTTANQSARGFDLGFLSQVSASSDTPAQSFTLAADGASLVPTQQVSATGTIELSSALPGRGVVVDPGAQLAVQISRAINTQTNRFSIRLDPPELGRIDVKLDFARDGAVRATVSAERPDTLDLLQKDVQSLERALRDAGTDPNKLSLNFSLQGEQGEGQMAEQGQNDSADAHDGTGDDDGNQSDTDGPDRYRPKADALVDLHV